MTREVKHTLRAGFLSARRDLSPDDVETARAGVRNAVLARCGAWQCVAGYRPLRTEPGSVELLEQLDACGVRVLVPVLREDRDLDWAPWSAPDQRLGVATIGEADAVLVPALAVDRTGVRLGRGGGSYDRALRRVRPDAAIVALVYASEIIEQLPADAWDVPVTAAVTPSGWRDLPDLS